MSLPMDPSAGKPATSTPGERRPSLPESYRTVNIPAQGHGLRRFLAFVGPGFLVAVGYMDPGNWATNIAAGSAYGYSLLWVVLLSNLMAVLLQILSARLGIVSGQDLAQACRAHYSRRASLAQWFLCEFAICACDLAEVVGTAIALQLLFKLPLVVGVCITALDVLVVLYLQQRGFRYFEAFIGGLIAIIFVSFAINLLLANPAWSQVAHGLVPHTALLSDRKMLFIAVGIIGATVMPHNLYLHSSVVQTRRYTEDTPGRKSALRFATLDAALALGVAFLVNAAILMTAAAAFHSSGHTNIVELQDAYELLTPLLGTGLAATLFGVALLAAGQSSTLTATLAGQIVMEGYTNLKMRPWARRLLTRSIAVVPALIITSLYGEHGLARLLLLSQVILSLQLPFAMVPLIRFTSDRLKMGEFATPLWMATLAWATASVIIFLSLLLVFSPG
jgi:manganese transport protein